MQEKRMSKKEKALLREMFDLVRLKYRPPLPEEIAKAVGLHKKRKN